MGLVALAPSDDREEEVIRVRCTSTNECASNQYVFIICKVITYTNTAVFVKIHCLLWETKITS